MAPSAEVWLQPRVFSPALALVEWSTRMFSVNDGDRRTVALYSLQEYGARMGAKEEKQSTANVPVGSHGAVNVNLIFWL